MKKTTKELEEKIISLIDLLGDIDSNVKDRFVHQLYHKHYWRDSWAYDSSLETWPKNPSP